MNDRDFDCAVTVVSEGVSYFSSFRKQYPLPTMVVVAGGLHPMGESTAKPVSIYNRFVCNWKEQRYCSREHPFENLSADSLP